MYFAVPADHRVKIKESEKKDKYLNIAREIKKKSVEMVDDSDIIVVVVLRTVSWGEGKN